jgi:hypothetical protein
MTTDKIIYDLLPDDMPNEQAKQLSRRISNALYSEGPQLAKEAIEYALHMRDLWSAEQFGTHTPPHLVNRIKEGLLIMERKLEAAGRALLEPTIEPDKEVSAEEVWKGVSNPPKENGFYLVYDENIYGHEEKLRVEIYRYSTYNDSWYWGGNCYHPTYWRELPPLPNKENVSASLVREHKLGGENLDASVRQDSSIVVSHNSTSNNTNQQK